MAQYRSEQRGHSINQSCVYDAKIQHQPAQMHMHSTEMSHRILHSKKDSKEHLLSGEMFGGSIHSHHELSSVICRR